MWPSGPSQNFFKCAIFVFFFWHTRLRSRCGSMANMLIPANSRLNNFPNYFFTLGTFFFPLNKLKQQLKNTVVSKDIYPSSITTSSCMIAGVRGYTLDRSPVPSRYLRLYFPYINIYLSYKTIDIYKLLAWQFVGNFFFV